MTLAPMIIMVGPTAVGKTEIAIDLALRLGGEIVSADSRLFYRGMDIGTAKPTRQEQSGVPHHLVDIAEPNQTWSLAMYQQEAQRVIAAIQARGRLPMLVGGTGQYIYSVAQAWDIPKAAPDDRLRGVLEAWAAQVTPEGLHTRLAVLDAQAAAEIDYHNVRRTIRALEVILTTGRRFSSQKTRRESPYGLFWVGLDRPRPDLYARIDARLQAMLAAGFVDEVRHLAALGYAPPLPALSAIGYAQIYDYLRGRSTLEEAVVLIKRLTRVFVRRQANWFKRDDPAINWFTVTPTVVDDIAAAVAAWLERQV